MHLNFRKILIGGIIILGIAVLALGVGMLFSSTRKTTGGNVAVAPQQKNATQQAASTSSLSQKLSGSNEQKSLSEKVRAIQQSQRIKPLSDREVLGIGLNQEGDKVIYYDRNTGQAFSISFSGQLWERVSDINISKILKVIWAPTRDKAIIEHQGSTGFKKFVYDFHSGKKYPLDSHIGAVVFSPDGTKILYHYWNPKKQSNIAIADYTGANWQSLLPSEMSGLRLYWPRRDTLAFLAPGGAFYGATLYYAKLDFPLLLKPLLNDKGKLEVNWSPSGSKVLYSYQPKASKTATELRLRDLANNTEIALNFPARAHNCIWAQDEKSLYCTVATASLLKFLPVQYQKKLSLSGDSFWKIDLASHEFQEAYIPRRGERIYNVSEMVVSGNEDFLFFVNKLDGKLYSLTL